VHGLEEEGGQDDEANKNYVEQVIPKECESFLHVCIIPRNRAEAS